jgi:hypothetical protein
MAMMTLAARMQMFCIVHGQARLLRNIRIYRRTSQ